MSNEGCTVGVDVGGTHLRAAILTPEGSIRTSVRQKMAARDPQGLLHTIDAAVAQLGEAGRGLPMAVGIAGPVHTRTGMVAVAPNLGWRDVMFGPMLARHFGQPVRLVNDLNAITVGEGLYGAGGGAAHVMCVFVGTGVGMGAVCHGNLVEGYDGLATELGHVRVHYGHQARACGCGERGCLEAHSSGRHLPALLAEKLRAKGKPERAKAPLGPEVFVAADSIEQAAVKGDEACRELWEDVALLLGRSIGNTVNLFNPEVLILGGGVLTSAPSLQERLFETIGQHTAKPAMNNLRIVTNVLGDFAGTIGAAILARDLGGIVAN